MKKHKLNYNLIIGIALVSLIFLLVSVGLFWTPYDANEMDVLRKFIPPGGKHFFGTDNFGRDIFSRIMEGAFTTFFVGAAAVTIGAVLGTLIGAVTGYFGGAVDETLMRLNDGLSSFPSILLALIFVSILGTGKYNIILALGIIFIPSFARVMRSEFLAQKELDYVKNAKLMGASNLRIMLLHIMPNTKNILLSSISIGFNNAVLAEAGLSYLALGVQPPDASLGRMLSEAQPFIMIAPWYILIPGFIIVITVLGVSLISEAISTENNKSFLSFRKSKTDKQKDVPTGSLEVEDNKINAENTFLEVRGLAVSFQDKFGIQEVLHGISFRMNSGEILGIVGESGSGKSITGYSILGLLPEDAKEVKGSIQFCGKELTRLTQTEYEELRGNEISIVFQEPMTSLNPVLTIGDQIEEILYLHGNGAKAKNKERVVEILLETGLEEAEKIYSNYPHQLSGGMRQRVMIAMAMIASPKLLIVDEPTTALDVTVQEKILTMLKEMNRKHGTAILMISHDLNVIRQICNWTLVMKDGIIIEEGNVLELYRNPQEEYTRKLFGFYNQNNKDLKEIAKKEQGFRGKKVLTIEHLQIYYEEKGNHFWSKKVRKQVGRDLSFSVSQGEVFGIVGESGSGKSSLAIAIAGLQKDIEGSIQMECDPPQMVFQDPYTSLNPSKTVGWILEEPLRIADHRRSSSGSRRALVIEFLNRVELSEEYVNRNISELSGGQRQRVAIAAALIGRKKLIVFDEAVSALDVTTQVQILELLRKIRQEDQLSYIFISHDMTVVQQFCDRVCVMHQGRIVEIGSTHEIFKNPQNPYTKELLKASFLMSR